MNCLSENEANAFVRGALDPARRAAFTDHVAGCAQCRILVAETLKYFHQQRTGLTSGGTVDADGVAERSTPKQISRYVVTRALGAGAVGVVYEAFDPQLKRSVALKLLTGRGAAAGGDANARLLREAEVMARV